MYSGSLGTVSTREDWIQAVDVVDEEGDDVTITDATIRLAVRKKGDSAPTLTADTDDGIVIATPTFTWSFTPDDMGSLCPGQYEVGVAIEIDGETTQLIVGTVSIVDGIVT
jgi:hypothetical protein